MKGDLTVGFFHGHGFHFRIKEEKVALIVSGKNPRKSSSPFCQPPRKIWREVIIYGMVIQIGQ
jgi:hypothetical protein